MKGEVKEQALHTQPVRNPELHNPRVRAHCRTLIEIGTQNDGSQSSPHERKTVCLPWVPGSGLFVDGAPSGSLDGGDGRAVLEGHRYHAGLSRMGLTSQSRLRQDLKARAVAFGLDPTGCVEREECPRGGIGFQAWGIRVQSFAGYKTWQGFGTCWWFKRRPFIAIWCSVAQLSMSLDEFLPELVQSCQLVLWRCCFN